MLLNHATGFLARLWHPIAVRLAAVGYEVLGYDARGHGDSDRPEANEQNYRWQRFVADLDAIVAALGLRGSPFVGHSIGGAAGLHLAGSHSGTFSRLAVIEPIVMPGGFQPDEARRSQMAEGVCRRRMTFPGRSEMISQYRGMTFSLSGSLNTWDVLPEIDAPVLVMTGRHTDGFLDMVAQGVSQRVENGRYVQLAGAGHLAPMECPDLVADKLLDFLSA